MFRPYGQATQPSLVEARERDLFGEEVEHLRADVFAALGVGDEKPD